MAYDDVISNIGGFGLHQKGILFLLCLPIILIGLYLEREYDVYAWEPFFVAGALLGGPIFGLMADKLGRRPTYLGLLASLAILNVPEYFLVDWPRLPVSQFIFGLLFTGVFLVSFVLAIEMLDREHRKYAGIIVMVFWTIITYLLWWKHEDYSFPHVHIVLTGFNLLFLSYYWLVPESGRWLHATGRKKSAVEIAMNAARANHANITAQALYTLLDLNVQQESKVPLFLSNRRAFFKLLATTILIIWSWFANSIIVRFYMVEMPSFNQVPAILTTLPVMCVVILLLIGRWKRPMLLGGSIILYCLSMLAYSYLMYDENLMSLISFTTSIFGFTVVYVILHIFAAEQFPTSQRTFVLGLCYAVGGLGLFTDISLHIRLEPIILCLGLFVFGTLSLMLAERLAKPLPEMSSARIQETSANVNLNAIASQPENII